jgi:hypothetical protein
LTNAASSRFKGMTVLSKDLPYFRWFPKDAESDDKYASLTLAELGLYHRCLNASWMNHGIPSEPAQIARVLRVPQREFMRLWPSVSPCFSGQVKLYNSRQERERDHAVSKSKKATDAVNTRYVRSTDELPRALTRAGSGSVSGSESVLSSVSGSEILSLAELENAWDRHHKHARDEPQDLAFRVIHGMNGGFDLVKFRAHHQPYCAAWEERWQYCPLTFLAWIRAGMPGPPPKPKGKESLNDMLDRLGENDE